MLRELCRKINFNCLYYCKNLYSTKQNIVRSKVFNIEIPSLFLDDYVWQKLDKWHNKTAVVCIETGRSYSYSELYQKSQALSNFLRNKVKNVKEKDVLAIILPNIPEYAIIILGIIQAGYTVTTINPNYTADEMSHQLSSVDTKFLFTTAKLWPQVYQAVKRMRTIPPVAIVKHKQEESIPVGTINFHEMVAQINATKLEVKRNVDDVAIILYSSGTTGLPKGVELTHSSIVSNLYQVNTPLFKQLCEAEGSFQEVLPLILPAFHCFGMVIVLFNGLASGCKIITMPKFTAPSLVDILEIHKPTASYLVPAIVLHLINDDKIRSEHLQELRTIYCGAAPIGATDIARLNEKSLNKTTFLQMYGLTETSPATHSQTLLIEGGVKESGAGLVISNTEFLIKNIDSNDQNGLGPNKSGEVFIRGPQVMKGYYKNPEATQATIDKDGWLRTGDIAYYDEDGHLFVTDRMKELIKVKGFQVAPAELEELLRNHPSIEDAAVVGVPHSSYGEVPKAFIVAKKNAKLHTSTIQEYVASKVTSFKQLRGGIVVMDSIPRNSTGKILRRDLKNLP